jgi:hypothetical protein
MTGWIVRYGFSKDQEIIKEKFLNSPNDYKDGDSLIRTDVCFARFIDERKKYNTALNNPVYYSLSCYKPWLVELINWVNSLDTGISIKLVKYRIICYLTGNTYEKPAPGFYFGRNIKSDFEFGKNMMPVPKSQLGEIKSLQIHRCAISISVTKKTTNLAKIMMEYLLLTLFRTLSINDNYFKDMLDQGTIIDKVIQGGTNRTVNNFSNHCLYERIINEEQLKKCFDINNMELLCDGERYIGNRGSWHTISQSAIIDSILERTK